MKNLYQCDICGCYLDPAEGRRCEECQKQKKNPIVDDDGGNDNDIYTR